MARVRDAYKIFGPRTVAVQDGEGGRWCIPWNRATQEIYRQKVAGSFRLNPVRTATQESV